MSDQAEPETTRQVMLEAADACSTFDGPTPRQALEFLIRMECAREGLPKPDFDEFPQSELRQRIQATIDG